VPCPVCTIPLARGERCLICPCGAPFHAAVHGDTLTAQCRFYTGSPPAQPCPVCLFGPDEFRMLEQERVWSCEGVRGEGDDGTLRPGPPTMSVRPLCAVAGEMAALTILRWALRLGRSPGNTMTELCAYTWRSFVTRLTPNPRCPCHHERWRIVRASRPLPRCSLAELIPLGGVCPVAAAPSSRPAAPGALSSSVAVGNHRWVERGLCGCAGPRLVLPLRPASGNGSVGQGHWLGRAKSTSSPFRRAFAVRRRSPPPANQGSWIRS
jgi:hypothetical protein